MATIVRRIISTAKAPKPVGPYSQAVLVDSTLYLAGQIGLDPETGAFAATDVAGQAKQTLQNMGAVLEAGGSSFDKVIKTTVLLADLNDFKTVNDVYAKFFTGSYPARAAYQVAALPLGAKVEIEAVAISGDVKDV